MFNYEGTILDTGEIFESTYKRGVPRRILFGVENITAGLTEGIRNM